MSELTDRVREALNGMAQEIEPRGPIQMPVGTARRARRRRVRTSAALIVLVALLGYGGFAGARALVTDRRETPVVPATQAPSVPTSPAPSPCQPGTMTRFLPPSPHQGDTLNGVTAVASDDVWAVGELFNESALVADPGAHLTLIEHWDGRSWSIVDGADTGAGNSLLVGVSGTSADDVWAVGRLQGTTSPSTGPEAPLIEHWDGVRWTIVPSPVPAEHIEMEPEGGIGLTAVAASAPDDAWAVGSYSILAPGLAGTSTGRTLIQHWDGRSWTIVPSPNVDDWSWLSAVSAVSANDVWAVGSSGVGFGEFSSVRPLIVHWDGRSWSIVYGATVTDDQPFLYLESVAAVSANDVWIAGNTLSGEPEGSALLLHWDGSKWATITSSTRAVALAARAPNDIWAAGDGVQHWDGKTWTEIPVELPIHTGSAFRTLSLAPDGEVWMLGLLAGEHRHQHPFALRQCAGS